MYAPLEPTFPPRTDRRLSDLLSRRVRHVSDTELLPNLHRMRDEVPCCRYFYQELVRGGLGLQSRRRGLLRAVRAMSRYRRLHIGAH
jgi:hypothetical protein